MIDPYQSLSPQNASDLSAKCSIIITIEPYNNLPTLSIIEIQTGLDLFAASPWNIHRIARTRSLRNAFY